MTNPQPKEVNIEVIENTLSDELRENLSSKARHSKNYMQIIVPVLYVAAACEYLKQNHKFNFKCQLLYNPVHEKSMIILTK